MEDDALLQTYTTDNTVVLTVKSEGKKFEWKTVTSAVKWNREKVRNGKKVKNISNCFSKPTSALKESYIIFDIPCL